MQDNRVLPKAWKESKKRINIMLTPTALTAVDELAEQQKLTRSEVLERLVRDEYFGSPTYGLDVDQPAVATDHENLESEEIDKTPEVEELREESNSQ